MAEPRSPWFWVLSGCAVLTVIVGGIVVALGIWGWRAAKDLEADFTDPDRRAERVLTTLRADRLPDDWEPVMAFSVPLLFKTAMLSSGDAVATAGEADLDIGEKMFIFVETIGGKADEARRRFEEGGDIAALLREANLDFELERELDRGSLDVAGGTMIWISGFAEVDMQGAASGEGLTAVGLVDCASDRRSRYVLWIEPPPDGDLEDPAILAGTPGDPNHLAAFLSYFSLCPE